MGTVFNKKELLVLLQDFHCLTGLRSAVFDSYGIEVLAYPPELPAYCRLIRSVPDGKTGWCTCDTAGWLLLSRDPRGPCGQDRLFPV